MKFIKSLILHDLLLALPKEFWEGREQTWPDIQGLQPEPELEMETEVNTAMTLF